MDLSVLMRLLNFFHVVAPGDENVHKSSTSVLNESGVMLASRASPSPPSYREFIADRENERHRSLAEEDCRGVYGCFPTSEPWEGPERPVSLHPESLKRINPFFCLHSPEKPECWKFFPDEKFNLKKLNLSPKSYVIVITHGFLHSTESPWMRSIVSALLENLEGNVRILALDWQNGAFPPYAQAVSNTRIMGAFVGRFTERLVKENKLKLSHAHFVGHSLGAHLFGYAGSYVTRANVGRVGRITGLDPAGPYFRGTPQEVRLDFSDAFLVDIIHTDSTSLIPSLPVSLGLPESSGHLDFFPNGGGEQKGCRKSPQAHILAEKGLGKGVLEFVGCSHERSHRYLTTSVSKRCKYIGVECSSWQDFKEGRCWDCSKLRCFRMGFDLARVYPQKERASDPPPSEDFYGVVTGGETEVELFLATTANEHLCGEQLRFTLVLSDSEGAKKQGGEYVKFGIVVRGQNGSAETSPRTESALLSPGDKLMWVDAVPSSIGKIHSLVVTFEEEFNFLNPLLFRINSPALYLKEIVMESLLGDSKKRFEACQERISIGETVILKEKCHAERPLNAPDATSHP